MLFNIKSANQSNNKMETSMRNCEGKAFHLIVASLAHSAINGEEVHIGGIVFSKNFKGYWASSDRGNLLEYEDWIGELKNAVHRHYDAEVSAGKSWADIYSRHRAESYGMGNFSVSVFASA